MYRKIKSQEQDMNSCKDLNIIHRNRFHTEPNQKGILKNQKKKKGPGWPHIANGR